MSPRARRTAVAAALALAAGAAGAARDTRADARGRVTADTAAQVLRGHTQGVTCVHFSPDGRRLASGGLDGAVRVWSTGDWSHRTLRHGAEVYAVAFSPDGARVASAGEDGRVVVWDPATGGVARVIALPVRSLALAWTPAGGLAVGSAGRVRLYDVRTGRATREMVVGPEVFSVAVSRDGRRLAASLPVRVFDLATGARVAAPRAFGQGGVAFSPDGATLAAGEWVGGASTFALPAGTPVDRLRAPEPRRADGPNGPGTIQVNLPVTSVAWSPDGALLATGGGDRKVQLWRAAGRAPGEAPVRVLAGHAASVTAVAFAPDGRRIASAALDRTVRVWPLRP
ncbi:MAG TPA: WD40 repeat domain-containing protein [Longimicrobium sp.]|jgi:WD40 repeat protein